jgi:hypothetical protein
VDETYVKVKGRWHYLYRDPLARNRFAPCWAEGKYIVSASRSIIWVQDEVASGGQIAPSAVAIALPITDNGRVRADVPHEQ